MKGKLTNLLLVLLFFSGLGLLLYPTVSDYYNSWLQSQAIAEYSHQVDEQAAEENRRQFESAQTYNAALLARSNHFYLPDEMKQEYHSQLDASGLGVMAYIEIPVIGVTLPIGHGTEDDVLRDSVGHLEWSSLPVGGESTHCILSGHRGLPSSELFTNVDHMEIGDHFHLHVLDQKLTYRVDNIAVVEPTDHSLLGITQGKDYVTLVTCTPYGINSHRLLVRGVRVESEQAADGSPALVNNELHTISPTVVIPVVMAVLAAAIFLILLLDSGRKKYKGRRSVRKREEA